MYDKPVLDIEGEGILEYALAYDLLLCNMCLKKRNGHLITDRSGNTAYVISKGDAYLWRGGYSAAISW